MEKCYYIVPEIMMVNTYISIFMRLCIFCLYKNTKNLLNKWLILNKTLASIRSNKKHSFNYIDR